MTNSDIKELLDILKEHKTITFFKTDYVTINFKPVDDQPRIMMTNPLEVPSDQERQPTEDELMFLSTDYYDELIAQRNKPPGDEDGYAKD